MRYAIIQGVDQENLNISSFVLYLGSDTSLDKTVGWVLGSMLTFVEGFVFMIVMFTLDTDKLHSMRARGTALHIALFMIAGLLVKTGLYFYINGLKIGGKEFITEMPEASKKISAKEQNELKKKAKE